MTELSLFAYPWDLAEGPEDAVTEVAAMGVNRLQVATAYHSAETIRPRRTTDVHQVIEPNVAHLPLAADGFGAIRPDAGHLATQMPDLYPRLAVAARDAGVRLTGWTIALHNSTLAERHPEHALVNCFGDRSRHGLCPSDPAVAEYVVALAGAVADTGYFDELMIESLSFTLAQHGHPHELWAVRMDPVSRLLLSLCFCAACTARGQQAGIDVEAFRREVAHQLDLLWNAPLAASRADEPGTEVAALLAHWPDLTAWISNRMDVVSELAASVRTRASGACVRVVIGSAVWARPAALNWMEGIDLGRLAAQADGVALMPYHPDAGDVARDLDFATRLADPSSLQMLQTIFPAHHPNLEVLLSKIDLGRRAGLERFGLYNLAMATRPVIGWVREVAQYLNTRS